MIFIRHITFRKISDNLQSIQLTALAGRRDHGLRSKEEKQHVTLLKNTATLREIHWKIVLLPQASLTCIEFLHNYS